MDKFRAISFFCRVAETKSFSAAAFELGVVPSVLSKTITQLEEEIAFKLFSRTTRRVALTEDGERYYESCRRILAELADVETSTQKGGKETSGRLRVAVHPGLNRLLMRRLGEFLDSFPGIILDNTMASTPGTLIEDRLDVLISIGPLDDSTLTAQRLGITHHVLVASPSYLARRGVPEAPEDLRKHRFLVSGRPDGPAFGRWTMTKGNLREEIYVPVAAISRQGIFMHEACLSGAGIARLAEISIRSLIQDRSLQVLLPDWSFGELPISAVYPPGRQIAARARVFVDFVRRVIDEEGLGVS